MKLPNHEHASVPKEKIVDYLLSMTHRDGRYKAAFFASFGFQAVNWQELADSLARHPRDHDIAKQEESPFGKRYVVDGTMLMADGRSASVRTVWFIDNDRDTPRFVTAYPLRR